MIKTKPFFSNILSHECSAFWQFVKYGIVGVMSTIVQTSVFYLLASVWLKCLTPDDWAVKIFALPCAVFTGDEIWHMSRGFLAAVDTAIGFLIANIFCWMMNRLFVFRSGKFKWYVEFAMFFSAAAFATVIALLTMKFLIDGFGMMTTLAVFVEVIVSFVINFFIRKFFIFKG